jgi:hypothetical protein
MTRIPVRIALFLLTGKIGRISGNHKVNGGEQNTYGTMHATQREAEPEDRWLMLKGTHRSIL